mmetsp:Transcript_39443/g.63161  ORF Transcript_39443/g.63161 Transcript_39443/m.63161 type:complete len:86 (+) Transcript_39443:575-832(+)
MAGNIEETLDVDFQQENTMDGVSRQHLRHGMDGVSKNESPPTNASGKRKYHLSKIILCLFATTTTTTTTHLQKRILLPVLPSNYY